MDIPRPENNRKRRLRQVAIGIGAIVLVVLATVGLARLEPAAPSVARASVWVDTVREGEMLRQVRGPGTLVPREIRWIAAQTDGRVERIVIHPGAVVEPDSVILEMSNPDLVQQAEEARYALEAAYPDPSEVDMHVYTDIPHALA